MPRATAGAYRRDAIRNPVTKVASRPRMKRRTFIGIAATGAAGLMLPAAVAGRTIAGGSIVSASRLLEVFHDPHIVVGIGRRYREREPAEDDGPTLANAILVDLKAVPGGHRAARLRERVRRDFAEGRTVMLNGWFVALTEARQCALYSLARV